MRALITISSCIRDVKQGYHQTIRDTWAKEKIPGLDYKFFIGNGKLNETLPPIFEESWNVQNGWVANVVRPTYGKQIETPLTEDLIVENDEIILDVPDTYKYLSLKTKESHRYAIEQGYDYVFQCFTDTYVVCSKLMISGFGDYDYSGYKICSYYGTYAAGGSGYWLSAKACNLLLKEPITHWAEDVWVGQIMKKHSIPLTAQDNIYDNNNNLSLDKVVTKHLCFANQKLDHRKSMYDIKSRLQ